MVFPKNSKHCGDSNVFRRAAVAAVMVGLTLSMPAQTGAIADKSGPVVLINVDEEMGEYIKDAEKIISRKDYTGAIEVLQALLDRPRQCFIPTDDPRRFVSLTVKINKVIGRLPPEGIKVYRQLYDHRAGRLFRTAAERFDEDALRDIISRYLHTSYGDDALNLLGAIQFDRGEFSQAARCWKKVLSAFGSKDEPVLLARIAIAHHFAGEADRSTEAMDLLARRHPKAQATLGGKMENVVAFTRRMLTLPPPPAGPRLQHDWTSMAGSPDSMAAVGPCKPALSIRWTVPGGKLADNPNIKAVLTGVFPRPAFVAEGSLHEGQVVLKDRSGQRHRRVGIPALIHPVIVGTIVLYRSGEGIVANDLLTGEKLWENSAFDLYRYKTLPNHARHYIPAILVGNQGLWTLTAGNGKVFAVGKFIPDSVVYYYSVSRRAGLPQRFADTSALAAFSIEDEQGKVLWKVGQGKGTTDLIRGGKFFTTPTFAARRLYVVVEYKQAHHLVCLDAENGRSVWEARIGETPMRASPYTRLRGYLLSQGSPPAVSDGKVFVVTNAGVAAAFEAATGRSLWAYQYDSTVNRFWSVNIVRPKQSSSYPSNPIIVTGGMAIFLPADSDRVLALRADTGKLDWSANRQGLQDLTAVNSSRLLLSGKGLRVIDAAAGKEVWTGGKITGIHGRPAVTTDAILASGKGEIIRVSLKDFSVTRLPVKQPDAILGNLICVDGKLVAANAAGVSVYFSPPQ